MLMYEIFPRKIQSKPVNVFFLTDVIEISNRFRQIFNGEDQLTFLTDLFIS